VFKLPDGIDMEDVEVYDVKWDTLYITMKDGTKHEVEWEFHPSESHDYKYPDGITTMPRAECCAIIDDSDDDDDEVECYNCGTEFLKDDSVMITEVEDGDVKAIRVCQDCCTDLQKPGVPTELAVLARFLSDIGEEGETLLSVIKDNYVCPGCSEVCGRDDGCINDECEYAP
jgi:hypothetical protein